MWATNLLACARPSDAFFHPDDETTVDVIPPGCNTDTSVGWAAAVDHDDRLDSTRERPRFLRRREDHTGSAAAPDRQDATDNVSPICPPQQTTDHTESRSRQNRGCPQGTLGGIDRCVSISLLVEWEKLDTKTKSVTYSPAMWLG